MIIFTIIGFLFTAVCIFLFIHWFYYARKEQDHFDEFEIFGDEAEAILLAYRIRDDKQRSLIGSTLGVAIVMQENDKIKKMIVRLKQILREQGE